MKIPSSEKIAVTYVFEGVEEYVVTHNALRGKYMLYKIIDGDYQKLKIADTPIEFDKIVEEDWSEI
jgi:hypothetical protein